MKLVSSNTAEHWHAAKRCERIGPVTGKVLSVYWRGACGARFGSCYGYTVRDGEPSEITCRRCLRMKEAGELMRLKRTPTGYAWTASGATFRFYRRDGGYAFGVWWQLEYPDGRQEEFDTLAEAKEAAQECECGIALGTRRAAQRGAGE